MKRTSLLGIVFALTLAGPTLASEGPSQYCSGGYDEPSAHLPDGGLQLGVTSNNCPCLAWSGDGDRYACVKCETYSLDPDGGHPAVDCLESSGTPSTTQGCSTTAGVSGTFFALGLLITALLLRRR